MPQTLEELVTYIRSNLPEKKTFRVLKQDEAGKYITYNWNGGEFLTKTSLETFELKNQRLFATGASMLMQSALSFETKNKHALESCIEALYQVGSLLNTGETENGLKLLKIVKGTLCRVARIKKTP